MRAACHISICAFFILAISCNSPIQHPNKRDIDEITTTLIHVASLNVYKNQQDSDTIVKENGQKLIMLPTVYPICKALSKSKVAINNQDAPPTPSGMGYTRFKDIYNTDVNGKKIFSTTDSAYFLLQNDFDERFELPKALQDSLILTTTKEQAEKHKHKSYINYAEISIPIFSADLQTAYVEVQHRCTGECGKGEAFILQKKNGHWKVVNSYLMWIS